MPMRLSGQYVVPTIPCGLACSYALEELALTFAVRRRTSAAGQTDKWRISHATVDGVKGFSHPLL